MDSTEIVIGRSKQADHVEIRVVGRMHPGTADFWDGNWLTSPVLVRVGGFSAKIAAGLRGEELRDFRVDLQRIYEKVQGRAVLSSMEHWVELIVECRPTGSLTVTGTIADDPSMLNTLRFEIEDLDQTDIPAIVDALLAVEERFPVLGRK
jgi:hypothetical protein